MYYPTKCNSCGVETNNQLAGDGCHACGRGYMVRKEDDE